MAFYQGEEPSSPADELNAEIIMEDVVMRCLIFPTPIMWGNEHGDEASLREVIQACPSGLNHQVRIEERLTQAVGVMEDRHYTYCATSDEEAGHHKAER